ncbi:hypothetical protein BDR07DRAFT_339425 [Suillus spraguei]|nr:hypothetical protein BDR07DRAFT_339425 [Suillus spraguei]
MVLDRLWCWSGVSATVCLRCREQGKKVVKSNMLRQSTEWLTTLRCYPAAAPSHGPLLQRHTAIQLYIFSYSMLLIVQCSGIKACSLPYIPPVLHLPPHD